MMKNDVIDPAETLARTLSGCQNNAVLSEDQNERLMTSLMSIIANDAHMALVSSKDNEAPKSLLYWAAKMTDKSFLTDMLTALSERKVLTDVLLVDAGQSLLIDNDTADLIISKLSRDYDDSDKIFIQQVVTWANHLIEQGDNNNMLNLISGAPKSLVKQVLCFQPHNTQEPNGLCQTMITMRQDKLLEKMLDIAQSEGYLNRVYDVTNQAEESVKEQLKEAHKNQPYSESFAERFIPANRRPSSRW